MSNAEGNVVGLMPHPEHAVDALTGSVDGLRALRVPRRWRARVPASRLRRCPRRRRRGALGLTAAEYDLDLRQARPRAQPGRAGDVLAAVERALRLQALEEAAAHAAHRGPARWSWARARTRARSTSAAAWSRAFKVESHNHPSAVEPFQGAATGVGGILRDIFAIGARPIAVLDSLRFGEPSSERSRYLLDHAVAGIGHYGNSIGVPTVGGEVYFEAPYEPNCLVNAMALGLGAARAARCAARRRASGNVLVLFGASTGRDGIGGASVLGRARRARRGRRRQAPHRPGRRSVRGEEADGVLARAARPRAARRAAGPRRRRADPSAAEMASKGGVGIDLDVARVPLREADMEPFEIMVSESQERMLCVCAPERLDEVLAVCATWEVHGTAIGEVTDTGRMRVLRARPRSWATCRSPRSSTTARSTTSRPSGRRRRSTRRRPPRSPTARRARDAAGAAGLAEPRLAPPALRAVRLARAVAHRAPPRRRPTPPCCCCPTAARSASAIDGNGRRVAADPYWGTVEAVLECAANLACAGAEPLGTTNNLNFGNPEKPHIAWQLTEAVRGLGDACRALDAPIVGGNVSLYNEGAAGPIYPTPVVGMVGRLPDARAPAAPGSRTGGRRLGPGRLAARRRWRRASWPSCAASRCPTGCPRSTSAQCAPCWRAIREAVRAGDLAVPRRRRGRLPRRARRGLPGRRRRRDARPRRGTGAGVPDEILFGEDAGGFIVSASGPRSSAWRERVRSTSSARSAATRWTRAAPASAGRSTSCARPRRARALFP